MQEMPLLAQFCADWRSATTTTTPLVISRYCWSNTNKSITFYGDGENKQKDLELNIEVHFRARLCIPLQNCEADNPTSKPPFRWFIAILLGCH